MTLVEKIITLAALDMPPQMIVNELDHQYTRLEVTLACYRLAHSGVLPSLRNTPQQRVIIKRAQLDRANRLRRVRRAELRARSWEAKSA